MRLDRYIGDYIPHSYPVSGLSQRATQDPSSSASVRVLVHQRIGITSLPPELILRIKSYLPFDDVLSLRSTCRHLCRVGITALPPEIIAGIISYLPIDDVLSLRSTCRHLYHTVHGFLTPRFWRLRTQAGDTLSWLLPPELDALFANEDDFGDRWEDGLRALTAASKKFTNEDYIGRPRNANPPPPGLRNRWRIWRILKQIGIRGDELGGTAGRER